MLNPNPNKISEKTQQLIDKFLLEKILLEGIVRSTQVSKRWLQYYVNKKYTELVNKYEENSALNTKKSPQPLIVEVDEL